MKTIKLTGILLTLIYTSSVQALTFAASKNRHIDILGVIDGSMVNIAQQIDKLSQRSDEPITMLINSPGGYVFVGDIILNAMKIAQQRGVEFHCLSTVYAASMAFSIYNACDYRYAFETTRLLFHPMWIATQGSRVSELAVSIQNSVEREARLKEELQQKLKMDTTLFELNYQAETFWTASRLQAYAAFNYIRIIDSVKNIPNLFAVTSRRSIFGKANKQNLPESVQRVIKRLAEEGLN